MKIEQARLFEPLGVRARKPATTRADLYAKGALNQQLTGQFNLLHDRRIDLMKPADWRHSESALLSLRG